MRDLQKVLSILLIFIGFVEIKIQINPTVRSDQPWTNTSPLQQLHKQPIPQPPTNVQPRQLSLAQYEQLKIGMTYYEVQSILLIRGVELASTETTTTYTWSNPDHKSGITGTFKNGKLYRKQQFGLEKA